MAKVPDEMGKGGSHLTGASTGVNLKELLNGIAADLGKLQQAVVDLDTAGAHGISIPTMETEESDK